MSDRAKQLADRLDAYNREVIAFVEKCTETQWGKRLEWEDWSLGVTARHIAAGHFEIVGLAKMLLAEGKLPPITMEQLTEMANQHAREHAGCTREEVLGLLRTNGAALVAFAAGLSDAELDRSAFLLTVRGDVTTQQLIEYVVLTSAGEHFQHMKTAAAAPS